MRDNVLFATAWPVKAMAKPPIFFIQNRETLLRTTFVLFPQTVWKLRMRIFLKQSLGECRDPLCHRGIFFLRRNGGVWFITSAILRIWPRAKRKVRLRMKRSKKVYRGMLTAS